MLKFKKLELSDISRIKHYFPHSVNRTCDNTVGGAFMWRDYFSVEYAEYNETIMFKTRVVYSDNITAFTVPLGKDVMGGIEQIVEYCNATGMRVSFCTVTGDEIDMLETVFPDFQIYKEVNWSDYVYNVEDLRNLKGRKYNGQRNHINYFLRENTDISFEEITPENLDSVKAFYAELSKNLKDEDALSLEEHNKTIEVLENFETYGLYGGLLKANGGVVAFSVGENINNVLYVHIEKADMRIRGAYQVINRELIRQFATDEIEYVNREEDVGDEGLRYSKKSYHPCEMIDKYIFLAAKEGLREQ